MHAFSGMPSFSLSGSPFDGIFVRILCFGLRGGRPGTFPEQNVNHVFAPALVRAVHLTVMTLLASGTDGVADFTSFVVVAVRANHCMLLFGQDDFS